MVNISLFSPLIDLTNGLACFVCGLKLLQAAKAHPEDPTLRNFRNTYFLLVIAYFFFSVPRLIAPGDSTFVGIAFWIANVFIFAATAFFARITASFLFPKASRTIFRLFLVLAAAVAALGLFEFTRPIYVPETGATNWNVNPSFGVASAMLTLLVLVPSLGYFGWQAIRTRDRTVRIRSALIAAGILFLIAATGTFYTAASVRQSLIADLFSLLAFFAVFLGVFPRHGRAAFGSQPLPPTFQGGNVSLH